MLKMWPVENKVDKRMKMTIMKTYKVLNKTLMQG